MTPADVTVVAGIVVPSTSPLFLAGVGLHLIAGLTCVLAGAAAMVSRKGRGRHSMFGTVYYWSLSMVFVSAVALAGVRWADDYPLAILAVISFGSATLGRAAMRGQWPATVRLHITGMGLSYIVLLTAFYVDNGKNLPLWRSLPPIAYWLVPAAVGIPLTVYVLMRHPLAGRAVGTLVSDSGGQEQ